MLGIYNSFQNWPQIYVYNFLTIILMSSNVRLHINLSFTSLPTNNYVILEKITLLIWVIAQYIRYVHRWCKNAHPLVQIFHNIPYIKEVCFPTIGTYVRTYIQVVSVVVRVLLVIFCPQILIFFYGKKNLNFLPQNLFLNAIWRVLSRTENSAPHRDTPTRAKG